MDELALGEMRDRFPLPEGQDDEDMSLADVAQLFQVTTNTATDWHKTQGMPVKQMGGNGVAYVFSKADVYAWWNHRKADREASAAKKAAQIRELQSQLFPDDEGPDETANLSEADKALFYQNQKNWMLSVDFRRTHCKKSDVRETLEDLMVIFRDGVLAIPGRIEQEIGATPAQVELAAKLSDEIITSMRRTIEESSVLDEQQSHEDSAAVGDQMSLH